MIISKVILNRLRRFMEVKIDEGQSGLINGQFDEATSKPQFP